LFFRLNVIGLTLPPLRERLEDFPALAKFFLSRHAKEAKRPGMWFSPAAMDALARYSWPGNIRELDNVIARAVILSHTELIEPEVLALDYNSPDENGNGLPYLKFPYHESMDAHSRHIIEQALLDADGNQTKAAERLKLQRTYLARLLKQQRERQEEKGDEADEGVIHAAARYPTA
jgi:DNA-binding NtrC family response regulator